MTRKSDLTTAAALLGRKGGQATAAKMSVGARQERARKAVAVREAKRASKVTATTPQASQPSFDGRTMMYRWYVQLEDRTIVTWAESADVARLKGERRGKVLGVEPAPHRV